MNFNIGIDINLEKLVETRLLIQANSGGGKSYAIRKILEQTNGHIQQIVLDLDIQDEERYSKNQHIHNIQVEQLKLFINMQK